MNSDDNTGAAIVEERIQAGKNKKGNDDRPLLHLQI